MTKRAHRGKNLQFTIGAVAAALVLGAQPAAAAPLGPGSQIKLFDSYGTTGGGEFNASVVGGTAGDSFITFCLEENEFFVPGQTLYVKDVSTAAVNGGVAGGNPDFISAQTAYLYTQFSQQTLSNYDFSSTGSARVADANSLQKAIWFFENEVGSSALDSQAQAWVDEANSAGWTDIGNVRVLNLYTDAAYTHLAQDQLYLMPVPEPEIYAMMGVGLGLLGWFGRRRKQSMT